MAINGPGPEKWPPPGLTFNPGPSVISVSADVAPAVALLVDAHACHNPDYFKRYVRAPKSLVAAAKMEPHPHYTDTQLDELIAFVATGAVP